jgi:hypothetical protein
MNGWSVKVCAGLTQSGRVGLQSGPDGHNNDVWGEWIKGETPDEIRFPENQQQLDPIFFQGNNFQKLQVELCILYDGIVKKHYSFDGANETHDIQRPSVSRSPTAAHRRMEARAGRRNRWGSL